MQVPETRYARSGDINIAYQVLGEGAFDVVYIPSAVSHVDLIWDDPARASYFERLASFCRLIIFDKRGTGASDPIVVGDLETRIDDVRAVMDAAGSRRAAVIGVSEGGPMSVLFAATHPSRVAALAMYGSLPRFEWAPDFPWGRTRAEWDRELEDDVRRWGTIELARERLPGASEEEAARYARRLRLSASPNAYRQIERINQEIDVRNVLPAIAVPTLVLHRTGDHLPVEGARWTAKQIPGATFVELAGDQHFSWLGDSQTLIDSMASFLTGVWERGDWEEPEHERVLATVLFTDIVGSTAQAADLGDRAWAGLVAEHHRRVRARLARFRGREIDTAGDGFFASFDGPARAIRCARAISEDMRALEVPIRVGIHTGECEIADSKVAGIAVNIGARVASIAEANEVLVSQTVRDLVAGSGITFDDRGAHALRGIPGEWRLYAVANH
ncbi:MAG: adenylate/guanylate cyclase domain-containing protein [Actinobacteria bacterium]|nr:adenylate/guanylate cyclase domain-containing protein [Actinomycetota bacterium]